MAKRVSVYLRIHDMGSYIGSHLHEMGSYGLALVFVEVQLCTRLI